MAEEDDRAENHMVCAWRRDPEDSFSDWTVIVATTTSNAANDLKTTETFHIHKAIVGAGPRSSKFFCRLFKTTGLKESESSTSRIELNQSAADAFPTMLDFIYSHYTVDVQITTETAVALRFLANYFDVPTLAKKVNQFIQKDMNKSNIHIYGREAHLCQDEEVINDSMKIAAVNWYDMLASKDGESQEKSRYMDSLPERKQLEVFRLSMKRAGPELEQCKKKLRKCEEDLRIYAECKQLEVFRLSKGFAGPELEQQNQNRNQNQANDESEDEDYKPSEHDDDRFDEHDDDDAWSFEDVKEEEIDALWAQGVLKIMKSL